MGKADVLNLRLDDQLSARIDAEIESLRKRNIRATRSSLVRNIIAEYFNRSTADSVTTEVLSVVYGRAQRVVQRATRELYEKLPDYVRQEFEGG